MSHIYVIDPALHTCELDCYNQMCRRNPTTTFQYFAPALFGLDDLFEADESISGLIVLGSGASVYDELPWQEPLHDWLKLKMNNAVPTLGLCYGHQAIAHVFGGKIELGFKGEKKKGTRLIQTTKDDVLVKADQVGSVIVSHREVVTNLGDLERCGFSDDVETEVIRHPKLPVWGFQAHLEATPSFCRNNHIGIDAKAYDFSYGHQIVDQFIAHCRKRTSDFARPQNE